VRVNFRRSVIVFSAVALTAAGIAIRSHHRRSRARQQAAPSAEELFTDAVFPLLQHSCVRCHGPEEQKGDLRLDSLAAALIGGQSGPALVPGDPEKSLMLQLVRHADPKREMPPKIKIKDSRIDALAGWIAEGAPWPGSPDLDKIPTTRVGDAWSDPQNPIAKMFGGKRLNLWSLQPLADPSPPPVHDTAWIRNPVDAFILARIEAAGERPAPEADRHTLARRLYFDLTGLPPSPEQLAQFVADDSPDAYAILLEKLLDSRAYGEHWARFWQDVVRYSDSNGFDYDEFRPQAWRFRDYVIRSFNEDKPYNQFVREQLAGDEMFDGPPENVAEQDALIATGFLRIGPYDNSAVLFGEKDRCHAQVLSDMVETTGAAFLGMNFSCCKCHDHKVDPISQADYYRLQAVFENVEPNDKLLLDLPSQLAVIEPEIAVIEKVREQLAVIEHAAITRLDAELVAKLSAVDRQLLALAEKDVPERLKVKYHQLKRAVHVPPLDAKNSFNEEEKKAYSAVKEQIKELEKNRSPYTPGFLATDARYWPPPTHIFDKGDYTQPGEIVPPGVLSVLDPNPLPRTATARRRTSGRRTAFANWLFADSNPLTARVMVNRIWQGHFGEGLQATPNDFGFAGARPSNPELFDWLAREFIRCGWSVKHMHRLLVSSAAYRQGFTAEDVAKRSPFSSQKPRRLTAEELRDSMLAVSGRLMPSEGGPPLWPELPKDVLNNPGLLLENEEKTRGWYPSPHEKLAVRSIYLVQKRSMRLPMMETFDQPESNLSCGRRNVSTVAPQALTLLNSDFATEMAQSFAGRLQREAGEAPEAQVERAFLLSLQRKPDATEHADCVAFLKGHQLHDLCLALLNLNEFDYVD